MKLSTLSVLALLGVSTASAQTRGNFDRDSRLQRLRNQAALEKLDAEQAQQAPAGAIRSTGSEGAPGTLDGNGLRRIGDSVPAGTGIGSGAIRSTGSSETAPVSAFRPIPRPAGTDARPENPLATPEGSALPPLLDPVEPETTPLSRETITDESAVAGGETVVLRLDIAGSRRTVVLELDSDVAPRTVANFKSRVQDGYYDGQAFHRAIPGYLIQTGDPLSLDDDARADWGTGGPGYNIPGEFGGRHLRGALGMARLGDSVNPERVSSGSQFYVCLSNLDKLDGRYTIFGRVVSGMDVIDAIARQPTDANDIPVGRIEIVSASLTARERATELAERSNRRPVPTATASSGGERQSASERKTSRFLEPDEDEARASTAPKKLKDTSEGGFLRRFW